MKDNLGFLTPLIKYFPPPSVRVISTMLLLPKFTLFSFSVPVISVFELTLKPFAEEIDAVALPSAIRVKLSPVTPLAGMLYRFVPSPLNDPVNAPVVYEPVNVWKLEVNRYIAACEAETAFCEVPEIVANNVPSTVNSPEISPEPDTDREPDMCGSNIFI